MAENKSSFIFYTDWEDTFRALPKDKGYDLLIHLLDYVNDRNPKTDDVLINAVFQQIKNTLKRDLKGYEVKKEERSNSGRLGNLKRYNPDLYTKVSLKNLSIDEAEKIAISRKTSLSEKIVAKLAVSDSVSDSVSVYKYNTLFEIKNFNVAVSEFEGNKQYFYLAYRYWELWQKEFPNHRHLKSAKVQDWYDAVRLMVERDEQTVDRLVAIYIFLSKCQVKDKGYETFLFSQVKSLPALRKNTNSGEYRLDNLAAQVNEKLEKDSGFNSEVKKAITNFKNKFK